MLRIARVPLILLALTLAAALYSAARREGIAASGTRAATAEDETVPISHVQRQPLSAYAQAPVSTLFGVPMVPPVVAPDPPTQVEVAAPPATTPPPDPLAGYVFTGLVTIGGDTYALVENAATRKGEYLAVGDSFQGYRVTGVDGKAITLGHGAEPRTLALNERYSLTPLGKDGQGLPNESSQQTSIPIEGKIGAYGNFFRTQLRANFTIVGGENIEKLHDDYFNGKISMDELNQRAGNASIPIYWSKATQLVDLSSAFLEDNAR